MERSLVERRIATQAPGDPFNPEGQPGVRTNVWLHGPCTVVPAIRMETEACMKRSIFGTLVLSSFLVSTGGAQVGGSGTPNTIPQFTTATTIGDSPIMLSGGSIGIGANFYPQLPAKLFVVESRNAAPNGGQPYAVFGTMSSDIGFAAGVRGDATATTGSAAGVIGVSNGADGRGVTGIVINQAGGGFGVDGGHGAAIGGGGGGVYGHTQSTSGFSSGVRGDALGTSGISVGVLGQTQSPEGTAGLFVNQRNGNILVGRVSDNPGSPDTAVFRVDGTGMVFANGGFRPFGADFAESVPVKGDRDRYAPGDVLVIDSLGGDRLILSETPYSTLVAGVYSTKPGVVASQHRMDDPALRNEVPLAVVGIVPCKVTAENGPIAAGDLLVTSSAPGRAMKGTDRARMLGAVVGKALEPLRKGAGVIQILVTLQ